MTMQASYRLARVTDLFALILDLDQGKSVTHDAAAVIEHLNSTLPGGIGRRRIYYRDTTGRYDELVTRAGQFAGFRPCTESQQASMAAVAGTALRGLAQ